MLQGSFVEESHAGDTDAVVAQEELGQMVLGVPRFQADRAVGGRCLARRGTTLARHYSL